MDRFSQDSPGDLARHRRLSREPFFAEALPCEVCGDPCDEVVYNHERRAFIGRKCSCHAAPEMPHVCPALLAIYENPPCETLGELSQLVRTHKKNCPVCTPAIRKEAASERPESTEERRTA